MARRKVTEMIPHKAQAGVGYEAIWSHIQMYKDQPFTVPDIVAKANADRTSAHDYIKRLVRAGYVEKLPVKQKNAWCYKAVKRPLTAPRLRRDGSQVTQGSGRDHMWRTMKMLRTFTAKDLAISASTKDVRIKENAAVDYIKFLYRAGYLKIAQPHRKGSARVGHKASYMFLPGKNTGPKAPVIQRIKRVYDPNLEQVVWPEDGGDNE